MNSVNQNEILLNDSAVINALNAAQKVANPAHMFHDCTNNKSSSQLNNDLLFNDVNLIEAKLGQHYLKGTVANANCDCGR